ncbi:MAG TPA: aminoacyl-tRNA hydrolase [Firmicutes bacterium]|nr:aminoacyl-tRNA hydrolase [Bacillota bacterium]
MIKVIAGLGNPGIQYRETRHNIGFMLIDSFKNSLKTGEIFRECNARVFSANLCRKKIRFIKPMTFMNLSGKAVACFVNKYNLLSEEVLVVFDDVALPFGEIRIREKGSAGGHNGLESIIESLGTDNFPRLRVGIFNGERPDLVSHVLSPFSEKERTYLDKVVALTGDAVRAIVCKGIDFAQKNFNKRNFIAEIQQNQEVKD